MSLIKVDLPYTIFDGATVSFKSPADFSKVTGLRIYYPNTAGAIQAADFTFADANRNDVTHINKLFGANAIVKVILDTDSNLAFVQNADTNAYLEQQFDEIMRFSAAMDTKIESAKEDLQNLQNSKPIVYTLTWENNTLLFEEGVTIQNLNQDIKDGKDVKIRIKKPGVSGYFNGEIIPHSGDVYCIQVIDGKSGMGLTVYSWRNDGTTSDFSHETSNLMDLLGYIMQYAQGLEARIAELEAKH